MKKYTIEFFRKAGQRGGKIKSDKKFANALINLKKARIARWKKKP